MSSYSEKKLKPGYRGKFCIQDHFSSTHHFDFRLEFPIQNKPFKILRSWALPKHKFPEKINQKFLMIPTIDHSMNYLDFEGRIPAGSYGSQSKTEPGIVEVWDIGSYEILSSNFDKKYVIELLGEKSRVAGIYSLIRIGDNWLIMKLPYKKKDEYLKESSILDYPQKGLDPDVWETKTGLLKSQCKTQILNKLYSFFIGQGLSEYAKWLLDVVITGSLTSYQYTRRSDLDIHVILKSKAFLELEDIQIPEEELFDVLNDTWRLILNDEEKEYLTGTRHRLEFYFEPLEVMQERLENPEKHDGIYSILEDTWLVPPREIEIDFDPEDVFSEVLEEAEKIAKNFDIQLGITFRNLKDAEYLLETIATFDPTHKIIFAEKLSQKLEEIESDIEKIVEEGNIIKEKRHEDYSMRSKNNLIFKYLSRYGYLYIVSTLKKMLEDDSKITEDEVAKALQVIREHEEPRKSFLIIQRYAQNLNMRRRCLMHKPGHRPQQ